MSGRDATLSLEFADGGELRIEFHDGEVTVNDRSVGEYEPGSGLDTSWRALLGRVISLNNGPLARALTEWSPPATLEGEALQLASQLDGALEAEGRAYRDRIVAAARSRDAAAGAVSPERTRRLLEALGYVEPSDETPAEDTAAAEADAEPTGETEAELPVEDDPTGDASGRGEYNVWMKKRRGPTPLAVEQPRVDGPAAGAAANVRLDDRLAFVVAFRGGGPRAR